MRWIDPVMPPRSAPPSPRKESAALGGPLPRLVGRSREHHGALGDAVTIRRGYITSTAAPVTWPARRSARARFASASG